MRSWRRSVTSLKALSSSRRRFFSASWATVFRADLLDSWILRPANVKLYHQIFDAFSSTVSLSRVHAAERGLALRQ
jgi:hypothetical protein